MAKYKSMVITANGLKVISAAQVGGAITFTAIKSGSGTYDGTEDLSAMTDLKEVKQTFGITGITRSDSTTIKVRSVFSNEGVTEGYSITEIGLFARDSETGAEVLYAVIVAEEGLSDYFPAYADAPTSATYEIFQNVSYIDSSVEFKAEIVEGTYVTVQDFEDHRNEMNTKIDTVTKEAAGAASKIQTTCEIHTATIGWYRIAQCTGLGKGVKSNGCELIIKQNHGNKTGQFTHILMSCVNNTQSFKIIEHYRNNYGYPTWSKVRYTYDSGYAYLEAYYELAEYNTVLFEIAHTLTVGGMKWEAITPTLTAETVEGVTVTTTCDIPSHTVKPVNSADLAEVQNGLLEVNGKGTWLNKSILAKALAVSNGVYNYGLAENSYTDTSDLPSDVYKNSFATIYKRASYDISVVLWGTSYNGVAYPTVINYYRTDKGWSGWKTFATTEDLANYLPLTGGTINGELKLVSSESASISYKVANALKTGYFMIFANGTMGIWDETAQKWLVSSNVNGDISVGGYSTALLGLIGDKSYISGLGDGTVTSAISVVNTKINSLSNATAKKAWTKLLEENPTNPIIGEVANVYNYSEFLITYHSNGVIRDTKVVPIDTLVAGLGVRLVDVENNKNAGVGLDNLGLFSISSSDANYYITIFGR